jgi:hypothetical protein
VRVTIDEARQDRGSAQIDDHCVFWRVVLNLTDRTNFLYAATLDPHPAVLDVGTLTHIQEPSGFQNG